MICPASCIAVLAIVLARRVRLALRSVGVTLRLCPSLAEDVGVGVWVMVIRPPILVVLVVIEESESWRKTISVYFLLCRNLQNAYKYT